MSNHGIIAAGHPETAEAGRLILEAGGNAFDAAIAALLAACFAEPLLASISGGGFLIAHGPQRKQVFDFFCQTPCHRNDDEELYPIHGNFGSTTQEFHIGAGAIATPGTAAGIHAVHRSLCALPLSVLAQPALDLARNGVRINRFQEYVGRVLTPIVQATPQAKALFCGEDGLPFSSGQIQRHDTLVDLIDQLVRMPADWFYRGEPGKALVAFCRAHGGHLRSKDLEAYEVHIRQPLVTSFPDYRFLTNPVPSCGGAMIAFGLSVLSQCISGRCAPKSKSHAMALVRAIDAMNRARKISGIDLEPTASRSERLLSVHLRDQLSQVHGRFAATRGTTHISVADRQGQLCGLTITNGEGCGHILPGAGIMLNNMLGEEDVNPHGLGAWPANRRISSMMAPSVLIHKDGTGLTLGSGGSNRIRTALIQVIANHTLLGLDIEQSVTLARLHLENEHLSFEPGWSQEAENWLMSTVSSHHLWEDQNLFFGGVHAAGYSPDGRWIGYGDPRRGGVCLPA